MQTGEAGAGGEDPDEDLDELVRWDTKEYCVADTAEFAAGYGA
jgi:hypothetical protein